jgi:hypothetical protein
LTALTFSFSSTVETLRLQQIETSSLLLSPFRAQVFVELLLHQLYLVLFSIQLSLTFVVIVQVPPSTLPQQSHLVAFLCPSAPWIYTLISRELIDKKIPLSILLFV